MIDLQRALPDPTPPPGARDRVRAGIAGRVERWRRRRAAVRYAGVLVAAALAVAVAGRLHARAGDAASMPVSVPAGAPLSAGVLELTSRARVLVSDGAAVWLVRDDESGTLIRVDRGTIVANVAPRAPGRTFVIEARDVRVEVVGTLFAVGVAADGTVGVRGHHGVVRVRRGDEDVRVGAGDVWPSDAAAPPIDDAARERIAFAAELPPPSASPAPAPPRAPLPPLPASPAVASRPQRSPARAPVERPPAPSPYAAARQLEDAGHAEQALDAYLAIRSGPEAEDALYAAGRLRRGRLADPAAAHQTFLDYRRHFPDGRYARAVDLHILDHALAVRDAGAALAEADRFLAAHADDPLAPRFRQARATIHVQRGDCAAALADLDALPPSAAVTRLRARCAH